MEHSPLSTEILFYIGPVPIAEAVVTTWVIMAILALVSFIAFGRRQSGGGALQTTLEIVVETILSQIRTIAGQKSAVFAPLLMTLFIFIVCANLSAVLPGVKAPTAHLETPAALAAIVFFSAHYFGVRAQGLLSYLRHYTRPSWILTPLNILAELTRTFSLMVRLFGNMMSHELVLTIIVVLAGLLVPVPFLALGLLIGLIQAYIFCVLATVYIGAATASISIE
jgi:F-type H+-transporting ATPase subunit a